MSGGYDPRDDAFKSYEGAVNALRANNEPRGDHPTQKPVGVMTWCLRHFPVGHNDVFDPFMGSGTTGVACVSMGWRFTGIEIDEAYFDAACRRIADAYKQPQLFSTPVLPSEAVSNADLFDGERGDGDD